MGAECAKPLPPPKPLKPLGSSSRVKSPQAESSRAARDGASAQFNSPLMTVPPGWASTVDPASGRTYLYHTQTGETKWCVS